MKSPFNFGNGYVVKNKNFTAKLDTRLQSTRFRKAQYVLDTVAFTSMVNYMPMVEGDFFKDTQIMSQSLAGTGWVCAGAGPMGRYLYEGKVMVDEETGSAWARKGHRKVVTERKLQYTGSRYKGAHPEVTDHWFEVAKKKHGRKWTSLVKKTMNEVT